MYLETVPERGRLVVEGEEAKHALRVKRLGPGDHVELLDGAGMVAQAILLDPAAGGGGKPGHYRLTLEVTGSRRVPPVAPAVHVLSATPKTGGGRLEGMIDGLSQVGAASWGPLQTERGVVDPRETKLARAERIAVEASKQCGRAWVLRTVEKRSLGEAIAGGSGVGVVMADASGEPYSASGAGEIRLLIGPEGGWTEREMGAARAAGVRVCSFGPHVMRIETAAVVGAGVVGSSEFRGKSSE